MPHGDIEIPEDIVTFVYSLLPLPSLELELSFLPSKVTDPSPSSPLISSKAAFYANLYDTLESLLDDDQTNWITALSNASSLCVYVPLRPFLPSLELTSKLTLPPLLLLLLPFFQPLPLLPLLPPLLRRPPRIPNPHRKLVRFLPHLFPLPLRFPSQTQHPPPRAVQRSTRLSADQDGGGERSLCGCVCEEGDGSGEGCGGVSWAYW